MAVDCTFLVLINSRSGGQDGPQLLDKFRQLASEGLKGEVRPLPSRQSCAVPGSVADGPRPRGPGGGGAQGWAGEVQADPQPEGHG